MEAAASRFNGKLTKWNAERGFVFVVAGWSVSFEMELDKQGRKRLVRVLLLQRRL